MEADSVVLPPGNPLRIPGARRLAGPANGSSAGESMGWERLNRDRLAKVLALAASNRDGEALSALRKASGMLNSVGLDLGDLARRGEAEDDGPQGAGAAAPDPAPPPPAGSERRNAEVQLMLRQISDLHGRLARAEAESAFQRAEAQHWHDLTIEAARYVCLLENELLAIRRVLAEDEADTGGAAPKALPVADWPPKAAPAGNALGQRIEQFVAWQQQIMDRARQH